MIATTDNVTICGKAFSYQLPWDQRRLSLSSTCTYLAFDTETEMGNLTVEVPRLALASYSAGRQNGLLHPDQVGEFILKHADAHFIFHNAAFDFWVVEKHLRERGEEEARCKWLDACDRNRMHDTMLLDVLIRLAQGRMFKAKSTDRDWMPPRDLAVVAAEYTSLQISKDDPYRLRFGEIIDKDWNNVEKNFFTYAIKDAIVTYRAYMGMISVAERIMHEHGYDSSQSIEEPYSIRPDAVKQFGLLTEQIQVKGAVALARLCIFLIP